MNQMVICPNCKAPNPSRLTSCYNCNHALQLAEPVRVKGGCVYCGQKVKLFSDRHPECQRRAEAAWKQMVDTATSAVINPNQLPSLVGQLQAIARPAFVPSGWIRKAQIAGWEAAVEKFLDDSILSSQEESGLVQFADYLKLTRSDLDAKGQASRVVKARVLRDVLEGSLPPPNVVDVPAHLNTQNGEQVVWAFPETRYYEERTRRSYVGGSSGMSFRIAKGVYYRVGGFKGHPVETTEMRHIDTGTLAVTNRHLYFAGQGKGVRIPYGKIVNFTPYNDGVGVCREAATAKPQIFVTGDGWFTCNLVMNLAKLKLSG